MLDVKVACPGFMWYDADVVVREGLAAVEKGKCVYVPGRIYRWIDPVLESVSLFKLDPPVYGPLTTNG